MPHNGIPTDYLTSQLQAKSLDMNEPKKETSLIQSGTAEHAARPQIVASGTFAATDSTATESAENDIELRALGKGSSSGSINITFALSQLAKNPESADGLISHLRQIDALNADTEKRQIENRERYLKILQDHRLRDPDEIDKRKSNDTRRFLKKTIAGTASACIFGCIGTAIAMSLSHSYSLMLVALLLGTGGLALLLSVIPLASGESMSSGDVERLLASGANAIVKVLSKVGTGEKRKQSDSVTSEEDSTKE